MAKRLLRIGGIYRHFKGGAYMVLTTAKHTETGEALVIYASMSGGQDHWARPYHEFMSEVDREKYQDAKQKYRFELVEDGDRNDT